MSYQDRKQPWDFRAPSADKNWRPSNWQTWAALAGGGALLGYGLWKRDRLGIASSVAGAALLYRGIAMTKEPELSLLPDMSTDVHVERSVSVLRPASELCEFWAQPMNMPKFMVDVKSVAQTGTNTQHWTLETPAGVKLEWDADITEKTNERLSWRIRDDKPFKHSGSVEFLPGTHAGETRVRLVTDYKIPGGYFTRGLAMLTGRDPEQMVREDLRRFKQLMETGEIATTAGQSSGRSPLKNKVVESVLHENMGAPTERTA
ncbi:MAG TPA: SRPBCC family protein [Terriglobales bacterium]|nr:SRPBCC family protein [Terriglobales bacterium]